MINRIRRIAVISKIAMIEGGRKQIFHVLMLFALTLLVIAIMLGGYGSHVQISVIKDMCAAVILISAGLTAITLSVSSLPQEIEQKTAYPVLAKPLARWEFVLGKYLGTMGTVLIGIALLAATFCAVLVIYTHGIDPGVLIVLPYVVLEAAIMGAVATLFSTMASPPLAWFLSAFVYFLGSAKLGLYETLTGGPHGNVVSRSIGLVVYHLLPNLECFNFKDSIVHHLSVPTPYLIQTAIYGVLYTAATLTMASVVFAKREL